jgi:lysophospholipase L1-like esterase
VLCSFLLPLACEGQDTTLPDSAGGTAGTSSGAGSGGTSGSAGTGGSSGGTTGGSAGSAGSGGRGGSSGSGGGGGAASGGSAGSSGGSGGSGGSSGGGAGGAAGTAGSAGSGGGGTSFAPCPASGPCKILPLGDSITDGIGFSGGYRVELFSLALAASKEITYLGGSMNGPTMVDGQPFPRNHEGHSGWTIKQIDDIVPDPALDETPHIILLHIGTNDMYQMPSGAPERLGTLIDQLITAAPDALLVVAKIIPFPQGASAIDTFNAAVPGVVKQRADAGKHIILVDQFTGFPTSELGDGVHPNEAGYNRMAGVWYDAIESYLP